MIRGAIILGVGFSLGYAKAMYDSEEIVVKLTQLITLVTENNNLRQEQKNTEDSVETDAADVTAEAVEVPVGTPPATEGE